MPRRPDMPPLAAADLDPDPIEQFGTWFAEAESEAPLAEAIALATVDGDGAPRRPDGPAQGLRRPTAFASSPTTSRRRRCSSTPRGAAALIAYWRELDRQVRVRGPVERLGAEDSDAYFATRPRDSQLGAWASPQSRPLESRAELDTQARRGRPSASTAAAVPRPAHWGGYLLRPRSIEFWQGQVGASARPLPLRARRRRVADRAAGALGAGQRSSRPASSSNSSRRLELELRADSLGAPPAPAPRCRAPARARPRPVRSAAF